MGNSLKFITVTATATTFVTGYDNDEPLSYYGKIKKLSETRFEVVFSDHSGDKTEHSISYYSNHKTAVKAIKNHIQECYEGNSK